MEDLFLMSSSILIVEYLLFALLARMLILAKHVTGQFTLVPPLADRKRETGPKRRNDLSERTRTRCDSRFRPFKTGFGLVFFWGGHFISLPSPLNGG